MEKDLVAWEGFKGGHWEKFVNVRDFIQKNYVPYDGDASFFTSQVISPRNTRISKLSLVFRLTSL